MINKLKSTSGESIAETLVSVLISAFALMMLAGTINTASNLITNSQTKLENYYQANNALAEETESTTIPMLQVEVSSGSGGEVTVSEKWSAPYYMLEESGKIGDENLISYGAPYTRIDAQNADD